MTTSIGSGLGSSFGTGLESTYGTSVTPTRWTTPEKHQIKLVPQFAQGQGLRQGVLVEDVYDRVWSAADVAGTVDHPVYRNGMGHLIGCLMGAGQGNALSTITGTLLGSGVYSWSFPLQSQFGSSLTLQEGIPDANSGLLHLWLTQGLKVMQGQFVAEVGQVFKALFTVDGQDRIESGSAPTAVSLLTGNQVYGFPNMTVKVGMLGSEVQVDGVKKWDATIKRVADDKRFNAGNVTAAAAGYGIKDQPIDNGFFDISGTLDTEFIDTTKFVDVFMSQTTFSMIVTFTGPLAGGAFHYSVVFAFPACRYTGTDPEVNGPVIVNPQMPFKVFNDDVHTPCTITIQSTDSTL